MIGPGTGVRVYLACGVTDMRKGISGLAMLAQTVLRQKPASGAVFAFRGRRGDRLKLLYWDGQGCATVSSFCSGCGCIAAQRRHSASSQPFSSSRLANFSRGWKKRPRIV
jgi:transposase